MGLLDPITPRPEYSEYPQLREEADRRAAGFVDPTRIGYYERLTARPDEWASRVLGYYCWGARYISHADAELLALADERKINPPEPTWMIEDRLRDLARRDHAAQQLREAAARDRQHWDDALKSATVELDVYPNESARVRHGQSQKLGHAVPKADVYSGSRRIRVHPAGRALCETPTRPKPLRLESTPTTGPATCVRCIEWTPKVRTAR